MKKNGQSKAKTLKKAKTTKTKALIKKEINLPASNESAETLISQAIKTGASVETMEKLMAMRRELKEEWAKKQFDDAMAAFQMECPIIQKTKTVKTKAGEAAYSYAPIDLIINQVKGLLNKHGFSYAVQTETGDKNVTATCIAKHKDGHSESSSMELPLGNKTAVMSNTQVVAAALTFAKRYAFCNEFGILTGDEDNDTQLQGNKEEKDTTNYLDKLKMILVKRGVKNGAEAIKTFNNITGFNITELPRENGKVAKEYYEALIGSPELIQ